MKQKDRELLLIDLSARLPYDTVVYYKTDGWESQYDTLSPQVIDNMVHRFDVIVKPYLRTMDSMTDVEAQIYETLLGGFATEHAVQLIDWLNRKMFDYRGLIEKGLALEAPKGMYWEE